MRPPARKTSALVTPIVQTITGSEIRALKRDARNGRIAAAAALALIRAMQAEAAIREPFPGLDEVVHALKTVVGEP